MKPPTTNRAARMPLLTAAAAVLLGAAGCSASADGDADIGCVEQESRTSNALSMNALTFNAMTVNRLTLNGRVINGVPLDALSIDGGGTCQTSQALQLIEYTVGCALRPDQEVTVEVNGTAHRLSGQLGLAPEWADQACDETCQGWVSACLIGRINARGERVEISMRGDHPALALARGEAAAFPFEEAAYYGNVFADPMLLNACLPRGNRELDRVCGELEDCPVQIAGACSDVCDEHGCIGATGQRHLELVRVFRDAL